MPNEEALQIAYQLKASDTWITSLCAELCELAGLADEWNAAVGETFEAVVNKAAEILGVDIY